MKIKISVSEIVTLFKEIQKEPSKMFELIRTDVKEMVGSYISELLDIELKDHLKRNRYERSDETDPNYRNASPPALTTCVNNRAGGDIYNRKFCIKSVGETTIVVPRDRKGSYKPKVVPRFKRYEDSIKEDLTLMYLTGISTRSLSLLSNKLIGKKLSPQISSSTSIKAKGFYVEKDVSNANKELISAVEKWRNRDLSAENIKYIYLDGVNFSMRIKKIQTVPVLVAIGVDINGYRSVLGFQSGDKESASSWRCPAKAFNTAVLPFFNKIKERI